MVYRVKEFAKLIGKSASTLRRWEREGKLNPSRSVGNQRYYTEKDLQIALNLESRRGRGLTVVYCRVSSRNQQPELENQIKSMEKFCIGRGLSVDDWVREIGGGLNFKRKLFLKLMKQVRLGEIETIVIAHKDRLCRFAFDFIEEFASWYGCQIVIANCESLSPQAELVEDLMAIIHCFSCRLYGLRTYKKEIDKIVKTSTKLD